MATLKNSIAEQKVISSDTKGMTPINQPNQPIKPIRLDE